MDRTRNHYQTLHLNRKATEVEIEIAFRKATVRYRKAGHSEEERFVKSRDAFNVQGRCAACCGAQVINA
jgi:curved DNA-binding protein CbpA